MPTGEGTLTTTLTREQAEAASPDASSLKAAQKLLSPGKWPTSGHDDRAAWGECQGSGSKPYRVMADLGGGGGDGGGITSKCSCPSRKFPCKHGLALLVRLANKEVKADERPDDVTAWLAGRDGRATKAAAPKKPVDAAAQAKRLAAREEKVAAGVAELKLFLSDLARDGLADAKTRPATFWTRLAKRLVDAQAPGLARRVTELQQAATASAGLYSRPGSFTCCTTSLSGHSFLCQFLVHPTLSRLQRTRSSVSSTSSGARSSSRTRASRGPGWSPWTTPRRTRASCSRSSS